MFKERTKNKVAISDSKFNFVPVFWPTTSFVSFNVNIALISFTLKCYSLFHVKFLCLKVIFHQICVNVFVTLISSTLIYGALISYNKVNVRAIIKGHNLTSNLWHQSQVSSLDVTANGFSLSKKRMHATLKCFGWALFCSLSSAIEMLCGTCRGSPMEVHNTL